MGNEIRYLAIERPCVGLSAKMPALIALSPATAMMKVAGAFLIRARERSIGASK